MQTSWRYCKSIFPGEGMGGGTAVLDSSSHVLTCACVASPCMCLHSRGPECVEETSQGSNASEVPCVQMLNTLQFPNTDQLSTTFEVQDPVGEERLEGAFPPESSLEFEFQALMRQIELGYYLEPNSIYLIKA